MAVTTIEPNNKLIRFTQEINREVFKESMYSPYFGEGLTAIIRVRRELKAGGEDMNIPMVTRLTGKGVGVTTLVGNEEKIENYGMRVRIDWARNAVTVTKAEQQKDSTDIFGEAKPLLSEWTKDLQKDEMTAAFMALPTETLPVSNSGVRVNGIQYDLASTAQKDAWQAANSDRIVYGAILANGSSNVHATALATLDGTADTFTARNAALLKRTAAMTDPRIHPYKTKDGYEHYIVFCGTNTFRDLKLSLETINKDARPREGNAVSTNPLFQDGDQAYDGMIFRMIPEISMFTTSIWTSLLTAGAAGTPVGYTGRVEPVFLCGQQAMVIAWGQMVKPTTRTETDYGFITGVGVEMAYGISKMFKKHPAQGANPLLKQWGVVTGFYATSTD
jgi:hypothetical protein